MSIVVVGGPFDGMQAYGPFPTSEEAIEWAERNTSDSYWVISLVKP